MVKDSVYTDGVIAVKENGLLKDKIIKLCDASAEEAFCTLIESGFGKGAEASSVYEFEKLVEADEREIDEFIREYAPTDAEREYFLSPRDFHNAKAIVKAEYLGTSADKMLAPEGLVPVSDISYAVKEGKYTELCDELGEAIEKAKKLFSDGDETKKDISGGDIGIIFDNALNARLTRVCGKNGLLKKLVAAKADMTNILTALRSQTPEYAATYYVCGGKLTVEQLSALFNEDMDKAAGAFAQTPYKDFVKTCLEQKAAQVPLTEAERLSDSFETDYLGARKYELKKSMPFLYYVLRRRAENADVRILLVCLLAGMSGQEIINRLRTF